MIANTTCSGCCSGCSPLINEGAACPFRRGDDGELLGTLSHRVQKGHCAACGRSGGEGPNCPYITPSQYQAAMRALGVVGE